jgi:hypothetical protein
MAAVDSRTRPLSSNPSASDLVHEYDNIAGTTTTPASASTVAPRRVLPSGRRARIAAAGTAGLVLLGTLVGWVGADHGSQAARTSIGSAAVSAGPTQPVTCTVAYAVHNAADGRASTAVTVFNTGQPH